MRYKKSMYNVEIDHLDDGSILLYNTYSGIFGVMDKKTQSMYNDIENLVISAIEDPESKENIEILIRYGYVVENDIDELATYKFEREKARIRNGVLGLTIAPTMACNMRCPYCYENKTGKHMSKENQTKLVTFVKNHFISQPDIKTLSVTWYGGEPLLQKETIYNLSESFIAMCKEYGKQYSASIITNGALLDKETGWKLFNECNVRYAQITIDGMHELHNQRRIFADGTGSFELIIRNVDECKAFLPISIRMNIDKTNSQEVEKFFRFATEEMKWAGNPAIYIAPVDSYTESCAHTASTCLERAEFSEIKKQFQKMKYSVNRDLVKNGFFPHRILLHCGAEYPYNYVIDPDGYFYTCWMVIGEAAHRCGHIDHPFHITTERYKWLSTQIPSKCESCEFLPMCAAGCGYFRVIKDGEPSCAGTYYSYKDTLRLAYQDYVLQKNVK